MYFPGRMLCSFGLFSNWLVCLCLLARSTLQVSFYTPREVHSQSNRRKTQTCMEERRLLHLSFSLIYRFTARQWNSLPNIQLIPFQKWKPTCFKINKLFEDYAILAYSFHLAPHGGIHMQFERGKSPETPNAPYRAARIKDERWRSAGPGFEPGRAGPWLSRGLISRCSSRSRSSSACTS
jgi:hypothetical protein